MNSLVQDTAPEAEAVLVRGMRAMPAWKKLRRVTEMNQLVQHLALSDITRRHPHASERELSLRLASRWLSADIMRRVWGWDPEREGY